MNNYRIHIRKKIRNISLQDSEDGLTNVITTVLLIAIIMAFIIGPYLTVMVPQQTRSNEAKHLDEVKESFLDLKRAINSEIIDETPVLTTRIKLGTDDENLFVLGGSGVLYFDPTEPVITISSFYDSKSIFARGSGNIRYRSRNLYLPDKSYIYESTGVIVKQRDISKMTVDPDFDITRRQVITTLGVDAGFAKLSASDLVLNNIYLINTGSSSLTLNSGRVSWVGGNASTLTKLNINGGLTEWSGSAASGILINFQNNYNLLKGVVTFGLTFDNDIRDSVLMIELFTTSGLEVSGNYPLTDIDTVVNSYDLNFPDFKTVDRIKFKNIADRVVTIKNIALSWTGGATINRIEIPAHGEEVWNTTGPGYKSPAYVTLENTSIFGPDEEGEVKLYFDGIIQNNNINIKFFTENSTNTANTEFPTNLNATYINASFSMVTLISEQFDVAGKSSKIIKTTLISTEKNKYIWETGENIRFNITTKYSGAWFTYLNNSFVENTDLIWDYDGVGAFPGDYYITTEQIDDEFTTISVILNSVFKLDCIIGVVEATLG